MEEAAMRQLCRLHIVDTYTYNFPCRFLLLVGLLLASICYFFHSFIRSFDSLARESIHNSDTYETHPHNHAFYGNEVAKRRMNKHILVTRKAHSMNIAAMIRCKIVPIYAYTQL